MTIDTTKDARPEASADTATEPPTASPPPPGPVVAHATREPDLEARIRARHVELVAQLRELKTDRRLGAAEATDKVRARLSELSHVLKWGVVDGWASVGDNVKHRLEAWLAESMRQLPTQARPAETGQS